MFRNEMDVVVLKGVLLTMLLRLRGYVEKDCGLAY